MGCPPVPMQVAGRLFHLSRSYKIARRINVEYPNRIVFWFARSISWISSGRSVVSCISYASAPLCVSIQLGAPFAGLISLQFSGLCPSELFVSEHKGGHSLLYFLLRTVRHRTKPDLCTSQLANAATIPFRNRAFADLFFLAFTRIHLERLFLSSTDWLVYLSLLIVEALWFFLCCAIRLANFSVLRR